MKISGFSMAKNANKLYYPIKQSIESILPIVDEFVVAVGDCNPDDRTRALIQEIDSDKIKIIDTVWDYDKYPRGMEHAHQSDLAKEACTGDWLIYLQADEVIHEKYLPVIQKRCEELLHDKEVEGLLFKYLHFWGDYWHYHYSHKWYKHEIRVIRNDPDIHSWESAQSFRRIPNFDGIHYRQQEGTCKLKVAPVDAYIFHYGWVRPPGLMVNKMKALHTNHWGKKAAEEMMKNLNFDYGPLNHLKKYKGTHPKVMKEWISKFHWEEALQYKGKPSKFRKKHSHEKMKYRLLSWFENTLLGGYSLGAFRNYKLVKR